MFLFVEFAVNNTKKRTLDECYGAKAIAIAFLLLIASTAGCRGIR